jgi:outer membrane protein TolC
LNSVNLKDGILDTDFQYESRAELRTLSVARDLQLLDLKRNQLGYLPTVAAQANYTVAGQGQQLFNRNFFWIPSSFVGLNISIPIFDGFQRRYKVNQSRLNVEKLDNTIKLVKQGIDLEQNITRQNLKTALFNLDVQERNIQLAEKVFNTTKLKFQQGLGSSFEVLQADADYQTAQSNYFNALYNAVIAKTSYLYSLGKL